MNNDLGCFDWSASFYDETRALPSELYQDISNSLKETVPLSLSMKCLEIGVGTGRIAHCIANAFSTEVYGVDISQSMLYQCLKNPAVSETLALIAADGNHLPFKSKFDLILTSHVLHQVKDHFQLVGSILNSLSSSGVYIDLNAYIDHEQSLPFKIFYERLLEEGYRHYFKNDLIRKGLKVFFSQRGWIYRELNLKRSYSITINTLVRFLKNKVFSHQRRIPERVYAKALAYLYETLDTRNVDLSQVIELPAYAHLLVFTSPAGRDQI